MSKIKSFFDSLTDKDQTLWEWLDENPGMYIRWYYAGGFSPQPVEFVFKKKGMRLFMESLEEIENATQDIRDKYGERRVEDTCSEAPPRQQPVAGSVQHQCWT